MTEILEVRDAENWFVGAWTKSGQITFFDEEDERQFKAVTLTQFISQIVPQDSPQLSIKIFQLTDWSVLLNYVIEQLNAKYQLNLQVRKRADILFVLKNDSIVWNLLPDFPVKFDKAFSDSVKFDRNKTLLIATRNEGKTREFKELFQDFGYQIKNLNDYPDLPEIEETGSSFEENARLKAETISDITGEVVIGDDSGLCVDVLGGLPGIWSHRFAGPNPTDQENVAKLLHELASTSSQPERRTAHFHTTLVAARPKHESLVVEADWFGTIALTPQGENGFGYDPIFLVGDSKRSAAELSEQEKNQQSHRGQALQKLMQRLPEWLNN